MKVYIAMFCEDVLKVFLNKIKADAYVAKCNNVGWVKKSVKDEPNARLPYYVIERKVKE